MADKDPDGPSLELPSLGFGRKKRSKKDVDAEAEAPAEDTAPAPAPEAGQTDEEPVEEPVEETAPLASVEPETQPEPEVATAGQRTEDMAPAEPQAPPLFADEAPTRIEQPAEAEAEPVPAGGERKAEKPSRSFTLPAIGGMAAAMVTGAVVGALTVGLTWAGFRLCEVVQGTSSCGNPGFLLLLAILIVMILLGSTLLKAWSVPDPGSTSFLAIGLLSVVSLLFLVDALFNWWMVIVIPILSIGTYALSHWVTTAFIEPAD